MAHSTIRPLYRPLYDVHDGGPPVGYRCMECAKSCHYRGNKVIQEGRVTRTLAGMRTHQRIVHGIKLQQEDL